VLWNCSPDQAVEKAQKLYGQNVLIEGGASMINELIKHTIIDQLELSVTQVTGGDKKVDWQALLAQFTHCQSRQVEGTTFYSAHN
jgi:dihydrofolate reductase